MNVFALGAGGLIAAAGAYLAFVQKKKTEGRVTDLNFMKPTPLPELVSTWQNLSAEGFGDSYRDVVATTGAASTDGELKAPYSGTSCAYFEATVLREYEKEETSTDKDGKIQRKTTRGSETVSSQKSPSPLYVSEGDVRIGLDLDGVSLHLKDGPEKFEPYESTKTYTFFGVRFSAPSGVRTLGFKYREKIIPLGHPLYVTGEVRHSGGALRIGKPGEKGRPFIISVKSAEEVAAGEAGKARMQLYLGIALMVIGAAIAIFVK